MVLGDTEGVEKGEKMSETQKGVNYVAVNQFLDQLRPFIIKRYVEIYNYNPFDKNQILYETEQDEYNELLYMLQACYEEDNLK